MLRLISLQRLTLLVISALFLGRGSHLRAQQAPVPTLGISVGFHSGDYDHLIYAVHLTVPITANWELMPWLRGSTTDQSWWRASIAVRRLMGSRILRPYVAAGFSWTDDPPEVRTRSHWGAVGLGGVEVEPPLFLMRPQAARFLLFVELQLFTYHYGTVQTLAGVRIPLAHP